MPRIALALLFSSLALPVQGRVRLGDAPLFFQEARPGRLFLEAQGKQFQVEADTVRSESALRFEYGINKSLAFHFSYPFLMESQGPLSKSGQGDLVAALQWQAPLMRWPALRVGARQALVFPSGFRRELAGFESFTSGRTQSETLAQLEYGDTASDPAPLWLALNGGLRTDNHLENTQALWGASVRYHLFKRRAFLECELAQEMSTASKETRYQFSAGGGIRLPFGFLLRLGAEERVLYDLDRFGLYAGLAWQHQPPVLVRVRHRHLRDYLQAQLDEKNKVPGFTLEPGTPSLLTETGRLPFLPLRVAILPLEEAQGAPVASRLREHLRLSLEADTSLQVIDDQTVELALRTRKLPQGRMLPEETLDEIGRALGADLILQGRVLDFQPQQRKGLDLSPVLAATQSAATLEARLWLHQVDRPGAATQVQLSHTRTGSRRWSPPPVTHGHRERPAGALERSRLTREVLEAWCADARESLLYEVSEQVVVQK